MKDRWGDALGRVKQAAGSGDMFSRVREASEQLMRESASNRLARIASDGSTWLTMAKALVDSVTSPGLASGVGVLESLAGLQDEQTRLLESIETQVELLREGPFLVGRDLVEEAARARDPERSERLLNEALPQFRQARRLAKAPAEQSMAEVHLGYVQYLLGNREEATHWLTEAHSKLHVEVERLVEQAGDIRVLKGRTSTGLATYMYPVGIFVLAKKFQKVRKAETARIALVELQPVVSGLSQSLEALGAGRLDSYEFLPGEDGWTFQPITAAD